MSMSFFNVLRNFFSFYRKLNPTNDCCVWLLSSSYGPSYFFAFSFVYIEEKCIHKISNEDTFIHIFNQKIFFRSQQSATNKLEEEEEEEEEWVVDKRKRRGRRRYSFGHIEKEDDKIIICHTEAINTKVNYLSIFVVVISEVNNLHQCI